MKKINENSIQKNLFIKFCFKFKTFIARKVENSAKKLVIYWFDNKVTFSPSSFSIFISQ